jgi:proteasome lid subunit RPN8/RPN11
MDGRRREPVTPVTPVTSATLVRIPDDVLAAVYAHAIAAFPEECCGYLVGASPGAVDAAVACRNAQADGHHPTAPHRTADAGFVIAGAELLAFARSFDGDRPARVVYHSHPNSGAYFSAVDREVAAGAAYPVQHLVVGVAPDRRVTEAAQFAWSDAAGAFVEIARWSGVPR